MTRLYEALTRRQNTTEASAGLNWTELGLDTGSAAAPEPAAAEPAAMEPPAAPLEQPAHKAIPTTVGDRVRLLPYALDGMVVEHYRRLRTKILQRRAERPFRSLMVASASPQEGKTLTVLNLALSFAMLASFRVLVVEGDLRKGTIAEWLGLDPTLPGFSNLIEGSASLAETVVRPPELPIGFMMRGNSPIPPPELLNTPGLERHFAAMVGTYDLVLVDSPPVNLFADASLLAVHAEAVLLVARAFSTRGKAFERAAQEFDPAKVIGAVLNAGSVPRSRRYGYEHYYKGNA